MANSYNVDDILAEVNRKKGTDRKAAQTFSEAPPQKRTPKDETQAHFSLKGMTGEFEAAAAHTDKKDAAREVTRTDLPAAKASGAWAESGKTQVIPAFKSEEEESFQRRRQQKVHQFMQQSFPAIDDIGPESPVDEDDEEEELGSLSQFFGGLHRENRNDEAFAPPITEAAPKKKKRSSGEKQESAGRGTGEKAKAAKKAKEGVLVKKSREETSPKAKAKQQEDEDGEYNRPSDARDVRHDILQIKRSLSTRLIVTGICTVISLYLSLCNLYPIPLLNPICPEVNMKIYLMVNLIVLVIAALAANAVIGSGLVSLFTLKADHDTPAALCVLAVIAHGVALIMNSDAISTGESSFYFLVAALTLFANTVGKRMMIVRIEKNFAVASSEGDKRGEYLLDNPELAAALAHGQGFAEPYIAYSAKIGFPEKFLKLSYSDDYSENLSRYISPIFMLFALALSLICKLVFHQTAIEAMTVFCVVLCVASPLTPTIIGNLPLLRASKSLAGERAFISGYDAVDAFDEMNCVAIDARELYPTSSVEISGIKALAQSRIDEAILDAASISFKANGLLSAAFLEMIGNKQDILLPVDELRYEDNGGLLANVNGKEVLLGKRSMMERHGIGLPPEEYEKKLTKGGKKALFVANSGEATAMIIVGYRPDPKAQKWLAALARKELSLIVSTCNPAITAKKISSDYRYPKEFIRIVPADLSDSLAAVTAYRDRGEAYIVSPCGTSARLRALAAVHTLHHSIMMGTVLQMAGLILGYALVAFMAFTGAVDSLGFGQLAIYQCFWAAAVILLPNMKKI